MLELPQRTVLFKMARGLGGRKEFPRQQWKKIHTGAECDAGILYARTPNTNTILNSAS